MPSEDFTKRTAQEQIAALPPLVIPEGDTLGPVMVQKLSMTQFYGGSYLARNSTMIPHVTHHDEADITDLEVYRKGLEATEAGTKIGLPVLLAKAVTEALKAYPRFNASLSSDGKSIILRHYYNIGMAVDTPSGLLVPVLRDVDKRSLANIADELGALTKQARGKGLPVEQMSGGTFTISSIGGLGGTGFTPIINAPEVAILGVAKAAWKPTRGADDRIDWRLMVPLSLSYDHRVINGADAARFMTSLAEILSRPEELGRCA